MVRHLFYRTVAKGTTGLKYRLGPGNNVCQIESVTLGSRFWKMSWRSYPPFQIGKIDFTSMTCVLIRPLIVGTSVWHFFLLGQVQIPKQGDPLVPAPKIIPTQSGSRRPKTGQRRSKRPPRRAKTRPRCHKTPSRRPKRCPRHDIGRF